MAQFLQTIATTGILMLISALLGGASFAWAYQGNAIWSELRLSEIAGCFGF
ncbi:MAG: hypothetical protein ABJM86_00465 [Hyphomicrobiales bacterium]